MQRRLVGRRCFEEQLVVERKLEVRSWFEELVAVEHKCSEELVLEVEADKRSEAVAEAEAEELELAQTRERSQVVVAVAVAAVEEARLGTSEESLAVADSFVVVPALGDKLGPVQMTLRIRCCQCTSCLRYQLVQSLLQSHLRSRHQLKLQRWLLRVLHDHLRDLRTCPMHSRFYRRTC